MNSVTRAESQREVEAIQLATFGKLLPQTSVSFVSRALLRFESDFLKRSWPDKARFGLFVARWAKQRMRDKLTARVRRRRVMHQLAETPRQPGKLAVALVGTGGFGDFLTQCLFAETFYETYAPIDIDFFCLPVRTNYARMLFGRAAFIRHILPIPFFDSLVGNYDIVIHIRHLPKYDIRSPERVMNVCPDMLTDLSVAQQRFEPHHFMFDRHPFLDGLFAKQQALAGRNAADVIGHYGNIGVDRTMAPFLCPDIAKYDVLERYGLADKQYITVHDGFDTEYVSPTGRVTKCWPMSHWNEFVRLFKAHHPDIAVVQIGSKNSRGIEGVDLDLRHKTDMHEACWVLKHALMHVDGESGMVRTARALHTTSAVLFGPTSAPFFSFDRNVNLVSDVCTDCWWSTPDWNTRCPRQLPEPECMTSITPKRVAGKVSQFITKQQKRRAKYRIESAALYATNPLAGREVAEICRTLNLPLVPISQHTHGADSGIYIHASKQWEYAFALKSIPGEKLKIADVGGGRGAIAPYLAKRGHDVTVFDLDYMWDHRGDLGVQDRFVRWSRANGLNVRFGSLFNVPAEDETFDVVLSMSVLEHVPYKHYAMREAMRILRPGGLLVMSFDFTLDPKQMEDGLRVEIFTPERLRAVLQDLGIDDYPFETTAIETSVREIHRDEVCGIPVGMTVGAITISKAAIVG